MADQNLGPFEAQLFLTNSTDSDEYVKSFELTFRIEYEHAWNHDNDSLIELSVGGSTLDPSMYEVVYSDKNTITVRNTELFTQTALDYVHKASNTLAPGARYKFQINFGRDSSGKLIDLEDKGTNFYVENCKVELIESYATQIKLNYLGNDLSAISNVGYYSWQVLMSDAQGNPDSNLKINTNQNPISFYVLAGNQGADSTVEFPIYAADNPYSPAYTVSIPRKEIVANAGGTVERDIPSLDGNTPIDPTTQPSSEPTSEETTEPPTEPKTYNPSIKLRVVGSGNETVDIHISPANNQQTTVTTLNGVKNGDTTEISGLTNGETYVIWATKKEGYTFTVNGDERHEFTYDSSAQNVLFNAKLVKEGTVEVPEPVGDNVNINISCNCDLLSEINKININNTVYNIDDSNVYTTSDGFVIANFATGGNQYYKPQMTISLMKDNTEIGNVIVPQNSYELGATINADVVLTSYMIKLKIDPSLVGKNLYFKDLAANNIFIDGSTMPYVYNITKTDIEVIVVNPQNYNPFSIKVTPDSWQNDGNLSSNVQVKPDESWLGTVQEIAVNPN